MTTPDPIIVRSKVTVSTVIPISVPQPPPEPGAILPEPPKILGSGAITLRFLRTIPGDARHGLVPAYHYRIFVSHLDAGHINLRVGDTDHVVYCSGHVGYEIARPFRGHRHALTACQILASFAKTVAPRHIITCDPDNAASRRTIELLSAEFINEVPVPPHDPHYARGCRSKLRYWWTP